MMQAKLAHKGFGSTASGKLNMKNNYTHKVLDLDDFDVQMLSPQFLQGKTLKRPFAELDIHLQKTNPNGTQFTSVDREQNNFQSYTEEKTKNKFYRPLSPASKQPEPEYNYINTKSLNIKPAYSQNYVTPVPKEEYQLNFKDKNSIISALLRKGENKIDIPLQIKVSHPADQATKKAGPAQAKLKSLFNKNQKPTAERTTKPKKQKQARNEIQENIEEEIAEEYENQSFDKLSGAYQSAIKQSIRQSIGGSSGMIKQSIRQSIRQSIGGGSSGGIKQSLREEIPESMSFRGSKQSIGEEIGESIKELSGSKKKESIDEEIYDEDFEEVTISDELSKSKTSRFKKSKDQDKFELSISASKGFRTKTNTVAKSIKLAQQFNIQGKRKISDEKIQQKIKKGDKLAEEIIKQKVHFEKLQNQVSNILKEKPDTSRTDKYKKNMDLYYRFKIQVNRLIASQTFASKLRKLTSFMNINNPKHAQVNQLQDKLLKDVMERIKDMRLGEVSQNDIANIRKQYDEKLAVMLKDQQVSLRVEMDKKLHQKDVQLKQMIAELEQKFQQRSFVPKAGFQGEMPMKQFYGDKVEVQSDYSIESDDISWKMDLWQVLPDYEKKKLYEKQGNEVAKMLTDAIFKQIKEQTLNRSGDISFQFPQQFNVSSSFQSSFPQFKKQKKNNYEQENGMFKTAFNRSQIEKDLESSGSSQKKSQIFPPLPGQKKSMPVPQEIVIQNSFSKKPEEQTDKRDTTAVSEVVKIISKYKNTYLRKKNDTIRKVIKTIQTKTKDSEPLISYLAELRIVPSKEIQQKDLPYLKSYEQDIINELILIYNKYPNRKTTIIEEQMKKMYDRIIVTSQVKCAQASVKNPTQIITPESYMQLKLGLEEKKLKDSVVLQIVDILAAEFAREMPRRKR